MKKLIIALFTVVSTAFSFGQQETEIFTTVSIGEFKDLKSNNTFIFFVPNILREGEVAEHSKTYESYFTVEFDVDQLQLTIQMLRDEVRDRHQIQRFIQDLNIRFIQMDDEIVELEDFSDVYLEK